MIDPSALHALIADVQNGVFNQPFTTFRAETMERVRALIHFDSAVWAAGVHKTNDILDFELIDQEPLLMARYVAAYTEADLVRTHALANPGRAFRIEDTMTLDAYRALPVYMEFGQELGIEYALGSGSVDPITRLQELVVLWRADRARPFSVAERDAFALLVPHLFNAWRHRQTIHAYEQAMSGRHSQQLRRRLVAVISAGGLINAADPGFSSLLAEQFSGWKGPKLPPELDKEIVSGQEAFTIGLVDFTWTPGQPRGILVASVNKRATELTEAEWRAVRMFISGSTALDAATVLGLSPSTIRNQIASAYTKLGVNSKVGLVRALDAI